LENKNFWFSDYFTSLETSFCSFSMKLFLVGAAATLDGWRSGHRHLEQSIDTFLVNVPNKNVFDILGGDLPNVKIRVSTFLYTLTSCRCKKGYIFNFAKSPLHRP
jgi:hypothetical protein